MTYIHTSEDKLMVIAIVANNETGTITVFEGKPIRTYEFRPWDQMDKKYQLQTANMSASNTIDHYNYAIKTESNIDILS